MKLRAFLAFALVLPLGACTTYRNAPTESLEVGGLQNVPTTVPRPSAPAEVPQEVVPATVSSTVSYPPGLDVRLVFDAPVPPVAEVAQVVSRLSRIQATCAPRPEGYPGPLLEAGSTAPVRHTARTGETWSGIALRHDSSLADLAALNALPEAWVQAGRGIYDGVPVWILRGPLRPCATTP